MTQHRPDARDQYPEGSLPFAIANLRIELLYMGIAFVDGALAKFDPIVRRAYVFWGRFTSTALQPFSRDVSEQAFGQSRAPSRARDRSE